MSRLCECCGQEIAGDVRSEAISTRFQAHVTWLARVLALPRERVYWECLLKALEIEVDGGEPYPSIIVPRWIPSPFSGELVLHDLPQPLRTGNRSNKQMMTACEGVQMFAAERGKILPERIDKIIRAFEE